MHMFPALAMLHHTWLYEHFYSLWCTPGLYYITIKIDIDEVDGYIEKCELHFITE